MTPTNTSLGRLTPNDISILDADGTWLAGGRPSKERILHQALYDQFPETRAVAHVHSTHAVAWSCIHDLNPEEPLPVLTAYYAMRVDRLGLVGYFPPGDEGLAVALKNTRKRCALLANHGSIAAALDLESAADAIEEIEETAKIALMLRGEHTKSLTSDQVSQLQQ
jgi:ribulose-5-phosphate 4-epimerase/fuculose-1-phosphate aldolase